MNKVTKTVSIKGVSGLITFPEPQTEMDVIMQWQALCGFGLLPHRLLSANVCHTSYKYITKDGKIKKCGFPDAAQVLVEEKTILPFEFELYSSNFLDHDHNLVIDADGREPFEGLILLCGWHDSLEVERIVKSVGGMVYALSGLWLPSQTEMQYKCEETKNILEQSNAHKIYRGKEKWNSVWMQQLVDLFSRNPLISVKVEPHRWIKVRTKDGVKLFSIRYVPDGEEYKDGAPIHFIINYQIECADLEDCGEGFRNHEDGKEIFCQQAVYSPPQLEKAIKNIKKIMKEQKWI